MIKQFVFSILKYLLKGFFFAPNDTHTHTNSEHQTNILALLYQSEYGMIYIHNMWILVVNLSFKNVSPWCKSSRWVCATESLQMHVVATPSQFPLCVCILRWMKRWMWNNVMCQHISHIIFYERLLVSAFQIYISFQNVLQKRTDPFDWVEDFTKFYSMNFYVFIGLKIYFIGSEVTRDTEQTFVTASRLIFLNIPLQTFITHFYFNALFALIDCIMLIRIKLCFSLHYI